MDKIRKIVRDWTGIDGENWLYVLLYGTGLLLFAWMCVQSVG